MTKLFVKKTSEETFSEKVLVKFTPSGMRNLKKQAAARLLDVSEFIRRAVEGRRADVRYEVNVIIEVGKLIRAVNLLRKDLFEMGLIDDEAKWAEVRNEAIKAMLRIEK
ncbi:hypothetical protein [Methylotenera sp.]|uniref:hypothetical protein n=1 Tax=Methylotenera sp. TaxID=2051956 RepID=UPI002ED942BB